MGCSLCSVYSPKTYVTTHLKADKTHINTLNIKWTFAPEFTKELLQLYDLDLDTTFNEKELKFIEDALISYLEPKNFLTTISYDNKINEESSPFEIKDYKMSFKDSILGFEYDINLGYEIFDKNSLHIKIFDNEGYFFIIFDEKRQLFNIPYKISKEINLNDVTFIIDAPTLKSQNSSNTNLKIEEKKDETIVDEVINDLEYKEEKVLTSEANNQNLLEKFTRNIKVYLVEIEKGEDKFALFLLLMASFVYGVIHALGPGHGKALAFSYFSAQKSSYFQAFIISLATAFIHILGALILVLISVFILQSVLNRFMEDSISYITAFCAVVIMLLAIFILYRKLNKKSCACCSCSVELKTTTFTTTNTNMNFVKTATNKPIVDTKTRKKQDLIFVLTAGIIPCPGTVLLFVYAFLLETYFSVILASISISLGMALVIFASAFLGVSLNKVSAKSQKIGNILEIIAPIFMFILALLLLLSTNVI
uniref:nickel/cobalt transporter n=1 Tax=Aliarcobacter sp. TaxID=2321116 RepID=UPI004047D77A